MAEEAVFLCIMHYSHHTVVWLFNISLVNFYNFLLFLDIALD